MIPPHVEYSLTGLGEELVALLNPLLRWITVNAEQIVKR